MKLSSFSRWLAPYLTAYLLLVSLGLPLHKVYCACKGESELTLLANTHNCGHDDVVPQKIAQHVEATISCCSSLNSSCEQADAESHDCGSDETVLAKFTGDYLFEKSDKLLTVNLGELPMAKAILTNEVAKIAISKAIPIRGPTPPIPLYGRELLVRHQLFLC